MRGDLHAPLQASNCLIAGICYAESNGQPDQQLPDMPVGDEHVGLDQASSSTACTTDSLSCTNDSVQRKRNLHAHAASQLVPDRGRLLRVGKCHPANACQTCQPATSTNGLDFDGQRKDLHR